jgi:hypothetical protein
MKITMRDGREFSGTPIQIVQGMRSVAFDQKGATIGEYIDFVVGNLALNDDVSITVTGATDEERSAALLAELKRAGFAT